MRCLIWLFMGLIVQAGLGGVPVFAQPGARPSPPMQPEVGPGGRDYLYEQMRVTRYGEGADGYWVFEPRGADKTKPLPVLVYLHGLNATPYSTVYLWMRHLVRRGNIVVYPQYQLGLLLNPKVFTKKSAAAIADAIKRLDGKRHFKGDTKRFAIVGHSLGGLIGANLTARAGHYDLPQALALMAVQPGDVKTAQGLGALMPSLAEDHGTIPRDTLMLSIATENDHIVGQSFAKRLYHRASRVPAENKDYILLKDDSHGWPALQTDHFMPFAYINRAGRARADAYDFALWRWFDALMDAAFYDGKHRDEALGNTAKQRSLGVWSDGRPVREAVVTDEP